MIERLSHATIYCHDQDEALTFYADVLGFEVKSDETADGFRWLTVGPATSDVELVLMPVGPNPMMDQETADALARLLRAGALGTGVFETDDCQKAYEELSTRGVEFIQPPAERPYGTEAVFRDPSGNWFSLTQRRT